VASIASYRDLVVWQKAMTLAEVTYTLARRLPRDERYVLGAQMRRAALSVPSNIAEGQCRTTAGFQQFLRVVLGSVAELETQFDLAARLALLNRDDVDSARCQAEEVARLIWGLMAALGRRSTTR
jgi:four helix bundle protein